ncbi:ATP-binding protein [Variovorax sp. J22P168]|uniref:ATP-binding protein n=1 Tax=Variovorax jilinensis TaxID=3053513 RepID=UPI0025787484|nr:ATP-binding protein [Variovorax sp. J22P168]MDM0012239.1 ATP-binding protein [Variovorax sp. J22P168]
MHIFGNTSARVFTSSALTTVLICVLVVASYFFGQPMPMVYHWLWLTLLTGCMVALLLVQFMRSRMLQQRDDELLGILDAVPHVLFFKDSSLRYRVVNAEFERHFEIAHGEAVGKTDMELFGPFWGERFISQDHALLSSGEARTFEETMSHSDGVHIIQSSKRPVRDRWGRLRGMIGVAIDVTAQKALQRELEDAHDQLRAALKAAQMGTWKRNFDTGHLLVDERARQVLGLAEGAREVDLETALQRFHPDDMAEMRRRLAEAREENTTASYDFRIVDASGAVRWAEAYSAPPRMQGGHMVMIGVNRDITERRLAEIALREAKAKADRALAELEESKGSLELALRTGGLDVWRSVTQAGKGETPATQDLLDTVVTPDAEIRGAIGVDAGSVVRYRDFFDAVHPEDRARVTDTFSQAFRQRLRSYSDQFRVRSADGRLRTIAVQCMLKFEPDPSRDAAERVHFIGISKDVSSEEELKSQLIAKAEEARAAVAARGEFLAMMSHEVRTPLNGVFGMIDMVLDTDLAPEQRAMLLRSREASVALLTIINDILDFSKIEARKLEIESRPLSLHGLIDDVCASFTPEIATRSIDLQFEIEQGLPPFILGDPVRLRQVLTNLIANAVKFTHHGGVWVSARRVDGDMFELAVRDSGVGITAEGVGALFRPFEQGGPATSRRYGGTGLGLSIVKQLVELMSGSVHCESEPGVGSRFVVKLPLKVWMPNGDSRVQDEPVAYSPATSSSDAAAGRLAIGEGRRILIAEDHELNREVVTMQLAKLGFECDCAVDGEEAWRMLMARPDAYLALLTDCQMPRLDGYGLTMRLRAHEAANDLPRMPIVALTANALQGEAERCLAIGMDAYLSKPLKVPDLRRTLVAFMAQAQQRPAAVERPVPAPAPAPTPGYASLTQLCGGRLEKVAMLVRVFVQATRADLSAMDDAAGKRDWHKLGQWAHRLSSACFQLDEAAAVSAFKAVERMAQDEGNETEAPALAAHYAAAREELMAVLARADAYMLAQGDAA